MEAVLLDPAWPATFRRSLRDGDGKIVRTLVFRHNEPLGLSEQEFAAVHGDIGKALCRPAVGSKGELLTKPQRARIEKTEIEAAHEPEQRTMRRRR